MRGRKTGKKNVILSSPITIIVLAILLLILIRAVYNIRQKSLISTARLEQAQNQYDKLESRQTELGKEIGRLSSEGGIEAELRTKYRAVKQGESVAVILDDSQTAGAGDLTTAPSQNWFSTIWNWISGHSSVAERVLPKH